MKKTYKSASYNKNASGFSLLLDKKPVCTPLGNPLILPARKLAHCIADEWQAQKGTIRRETMPLTRIACMAIDLIGEKRDAVCEEILAYGDTDLVCYRAGNIPVLQQRQETLLNPIIAWAEHRFIIELMVTDGLMPVSQVPANALKLRTVLSEYDDWKLAAIALATKPLGSLILALALTEHRINAGDAFYFSHLEEAYETEQWGGDAEKQARLHKIREEILAAEQFLMCLS